MRCVEGYREWSWVVVTMPSDKNMEIEPLGPWRLSCDDEKESSCHVSMLARKLFGRVHPGQVDLERGVEIH
jgi:hypothetical protein